MATKKAGKKNLGNQFQADDPIIVKPGGSISIEFEASFLQQANPSANRRKHKHPNALQLLQVVILRKDGPPERYALGPDDSVAICYTNSKCK